MLKFLGVGDAFSSKLGNCSSFYKRGDTLILIDCGENIFERIIKTGILEGVNKVYIVITHFHTDHVGSLGTLLFYLDKIGINDTSVIYPDRDRMLHLLKTFGVQKCNYEIMLPNDIRNFNVEEIRQKHSFMEAYGYLLGIDGKRIYYSGDTKSLDDRVLKMLLNDQLDYFYQDIRIGKNDYHISLEELTKMIPFDFRRKVECMHYSENIDKDLITSKGFRLVKEYRRN